jgi:hypothetical protein
MDTFLAIQLAILLNQGHIARCSEINSDLAFAGLPVDVHWVWEDMADEIDLYIDQYERFGGFRVFGTIICSVPRSKFNQESLEYFGVLDDALFSSENNYAEFQVNNQISCFASLDNLVMFIKELAQEKRLGK